MFSQVLVILSTGGGVPPSPRADIPPRQTPPGQTLPQATTTPPPHGQTRILLECILVRIFVSAIYNIAFI